MKVEKNKEIKYEIVQHIGTISEKENFKKEMNIISWNQRIPVYDIRSFRINKDGKKCPLKGLSLDKHDVTVLRDLLNSLNLEE